MVVDDDFFTWERHGRLRAYSLCFLLVGLVSFTPACNVSERTKVEPQQAHRVVDVGDPLVRAFLQLESMIPNYGEVREMRRKLDRGDMAGFASLAKQLRPPGEIVLDGVREYGGFGDGAWARRPENAASFRLVGSGQWFDSYEEAAHARDVAVAKAEEVQRLAEQWALEQPRR